MRYLLFIILGVLSQVVSGQSVTSSTHDFGKVKEWNNPIYEVVYTNTSGRDQLFLPIRYQNDVRVGFMKNKLVPGESTVIKFQYYTEDFGRFNKDILVYVSTSNEPIRFTLKGNIQSFHPDAFTYCPRIDNRDMQMGPMFNHSIRVIDAETKLPITDFEIKIKTKSSEEIIRSDKSQIVIKREKPDFYELVVDKENYRVERREVYINRNTAETIIALIKEEPEEIGEEEEYFDFASTEQEKKEKSEVIVKEDTPVVPIEEEKPSDDISSEEEKIPIKDTIVIAETKIDPIPEDTSDFGDDGKLNSSKYSYNNIVFLIDVSTSMRYEERLPLLKISMHQMIDMLRSDDKVSIITYSSEAIVIAENISGDNKKHLRELVDALQARGQSYGKEGVDMAYDLVKKNFIDEGNNEIILASDGIFNSKNFKEQKLFRQAMIQQAAYDIHMSTIGFGNASKALKFLETLSTKGSGSFIAIHTEQEARTKLVQIIMKHSAK